MATRYRIKFLPREKATYIKLRSYGYSISTLSHFFGRSTSVIHRLLQRAAHYEARGFIMDLRKIPARVRRLARVRHHATMLRMLRKWETWMIGDGEQPP